MWDSTWAVLGAAAIFLIVMAWLAGLAFVAWDSSRRNLLGWQRAMWLALAVLPMVGLTAYVVLVARQPLPGSGSRAQAPGGGTPARWPPAPSPGAARRRITLARPPAALRRRQPTVALADFDPVTTPTTPVSAVVGTTPAPRAQTPLPPVPAGPLTCTLSVVEGPHAGLEVTLRQWPARIGRGPDVAVALDGDLGVSRHHAELYEQAGVLRVRDTGSTHGTAVNDLTVDDKSLQPGDRLRVGHSVLVVRALA